MSLRDDRDRADDYEGQDVVGVGSGSASFSVQGPPLPRRPCTCCPSSVRIGPAARSFVDDIPFGRPRP
jgi:hypothetical protein